MTERNKILVLNSSRDVRGAFKQELGNFAEVPYIPPRLSQSLSLSDIEAPLREVPYLAIFMGDILGLNLGGPENCWDGEILAKNLQSGIYGSLNQETLVHNTSIWYSPKFNGFWFSEHAIGEKYSEHRDPVYFAKELLRG